MTPYRRITRLKQYIMDHYVFNLDLDTWGLTTKPRELARFQDFLDPDTLAQSNALFGYEGDKYYFDTRPPCSLSAACRSRICTCWPRRCTRRTTWILATAF